jgi:predicted RNA binding protein YcfA (HicA-like mRNA interferase family)
MSMCEHRAMKVHEVLEQLHAEGWRIVREKGSHRQLQHPSKPGTVTVAGKPSVDIPPGTLNSIIKQAGLKR